METWEVVLILALLTISILVISKHKVPMELITILDSPVFQIIILGLTLAASISSPAVAVVAVSTLVVVYYMRNVVKIQIVTANTANAMPIQIAVVEEKRVTTIVNKDESVNTMPAPTNDKNSETIEVALKENNLRPPASNNQIIGTKASLNTELPFPPEQVRPLEVFEDPRGKTKGVESFDSSASFNSKVQSSMVDRSIVPEIDSEVFRRAPKTPFAANENTIVENQMRNYGMNDGQYGIDEPRPFTIPVKYEVAGYSPDEVIGSNKFLQVGASLDDKITNMTRGKFVSSAPPPDFDNPVPGKMAQY
jgi:hypothetical protein